jgi:hypothetical protein
MLMPWFPELGLALTAPDDNEKNNHRTDAGDDLDRCCTHFSLLQVLPNFTCHAQSCASACRETFTG